MWLAGQWWWARILGVGDIDNMWGLGGMWIKHRLVAWMGMVGMLALCQTSSGLCGSVHSISCHVCTCRLTFYPLLRAPSFASAIFVIILK